MGILKYSENQDVAKAFLEWWFQKEQFSSWLNAFEGYIIPPGPAFLEDEAFTADPKLAEYVNIVNIGRNKGYAGPSNQKAAEASARYVIVNTFAQAIQSGDAAGAVAQAEAQLRRIYGS